MSDKDKQIGQFLINEEQIHELVVGYRDNYNKVFTQNGNKDAAHVLGLIAVGSLAVQIEIENRANGIYEKADLKIDKDVKVERQVGTDDDSK